MLVRSLPLRSLRNHDDGRRNSNPVWLVLIYRITRPTVMLQHLYYNLLGH